MNEANPEMWNGEGTKPQSVSNLIFTYDIQSIYGNELDLSLEYLESDESDMAGWTHYCELKDKQTGDTVIPLHGYGIDSINNLVDTIMDICREEN